LLGLNGTIVKAHGSARERAIMNAIHLAAEAVQHHINDIIQAEVAQAAARLTEAKT
jgi:fatty acid/phospholipid biosynthesis enzyme